MDLSFLPIKIFNALDKVNLSYVSEIRFRENFPVIVNTDGVNKYLSLDGLTHFKSLAIVCEREDIYYALEQITERSLYAYNEQIRRGYITTRDGIRIGICGECVVDNGVVDTIKNFTSLNVRLPHEINGCSDRIFDLLYIDNTLKNTLVISPPGYGKTTLLKDLARKLNLTSKSSILIIDERGEFARVKGEYIDTISYSDKLFAFDYGIRSMSPNIIITDELSCENDWKCVKNASNSGVKIIASCHAKDYADIVNKEFYCKGVFTRFVIIDGSGSVGNIVGVFDENGRRL